MYGDQHVLHLANVNAVEALSEFREHKGAQYAPSRPKSPDAVSAA